MRTSFVLRPHVNKDGTQLIALRVFHGKYKYFSTNQMVPAEYWDGEFARVRKKYKGHAQINETLTFIETRVNEAERSFITSGRQFSFAAFEQLVFGNTKSKTGSIRLLDFFAQVVSDMRNNGQYGNARLYEDESALYKKYAPSVSLAEITPVWLEKFEGWQRKRGKKNGGIATSMRTLRAVCNMAIKAGLLPRDWYPFYDYSIGTRLKQVRESRAISLEKIKQIESVELDGAIAFARDLFLFSFYTRGMNLRDIARLAPDNIQDGRIVYVRHKTKRSATKKMSVKIKPQAQEIIDKYQGQMPGRLFPIVASGIDEDAERVKVGYLTGRVNKNIRKVAELAGIEDYITFYTARHTYANELKQRGASYDLIGDAFGHIDRRSTTAYLDSFPDSAIDKADELLD